MQIILNSDIVEAQSEISRFLEIIAKIIVPFDNKHETTFTNSEAVALAILVDDFREAVEKLDLSACRKLS